MIQRKSGAESGIWPVLGKIAGAESRPSSGRFTLLFLFAALLLGVMPSRAQENSFSKEIVVAAAADLSSALQEISGRYEKTTGVKVKLSFGASGALTQQIQNGAPFDVFFSADMDYPRQLIAAARLTEQVFISTR